MEPHIAAFGGGGRATRSTVDMSRGHPGEEPPVKTGVPALHRSVATLEVFDHNPQFCTVGEWFLAEIGHGDLRVGMGFADGGPGSTTLAHSSSATMGYRATDHVTGIPGTTAGTTKPV